MIHWATIGGLDLYKCGPYWSKESFKLDTLSLSPQIITHMGLSVLNGSVNETCVLGLLRSSQNQGRVGSSLWK